MKTYSAVKEVNCVTTDLVSLSTFATLAPWNVSERAAEMGPTPCSTSMTKIGVVFLIGHFTVSFLIVELTNVSALQMPSVLIG